ncbi:MAG TPA: hypothetical protein DCZ01_05750 [Elusimicrobia bacterium]|nr:MAG: hypothetical protein A2X37_11275 [Elusimicrobia bacterium GWA2_66_18]HAZ08024.1 hypothetical protein [Elusimicrobiota bacterium]
MTPEQCPDCGAKLEPDMQACPNCPRSFPEDEPSSGVHPLKQTKAYAFLMPTLFFATLGAAVWYLGMGLFHLGEENAVVEVAPFLRGGQPAPVSSSSAPPAEAKAEAAVEEPPSSAVVSIVSSEAPKRKAPKEWRLRGTVYDLRTLKPVAGCALHFVDVRTNRRIETRSDAKGFYRLVAPPLPERGYLVSIAKDGYSPSYLDPGTEGVREMPEDRRQEIVNDLSSLLTANPASVQAYDTQPLITDFYLAPRR